MPTLTQARIANKDSQKISDFKVGDKVRVNGNIWAREAQSEGLTPGEILTVTGVHPRVGTPYAGALSVEGYTSSPDTIGHAIHPGAFGHMLFDPIPQEDTTMPENIKPAHDSVIPVGSRVIVTDKRTQIGSFPLGSGRSPYVGKAGTVTDAPATVGPRAGYRVEIDGDGYPTSWTHDALDLATPPVDPSERPLVHFDDDKAGKDRTRARQYAEEAISSTLSEDSNEIFKKAAAGESVDAYALNEAVLEAMRSATTRLGQSRGRRAMASNFAHLGHIVQAVLENHADSLPAYVEGERSRKVEELRADLEVQKDRISTLQRERDTLTQAAADERRRLCSKIDALKDIRDGLVKDNETLRTNLAQTVREANEFEATLDYAMSFLSDKQVHLVIGFRAGFTKGAQD